MKSLLASVRREDGYNRVQSAVWSLEEQWRHGEPRLEQCWAEHDPEGSASVLAALVKVDLRCRFARGGRPAVDEYLQRFPQLRAAKERVLSLVYEEFCLLEEQGEEPSAESFCARYAPWRDSLASQLKYHQLLSRVVGPSSPPPRFPEPGEQFREFALDSVLGQGGAARVYRARNNLLGGRAVALKVSPDRGQEPSIMGRLDHEHIIPVHSVVFQPETQLRGLIMPYLPGLPLDEVIQKLNPTTRPHGARVLWDVVAAAVPHNIPAVVGAEHPPWSAFPARGTYAQGVAWIVATLADAVAYAHARGVQHRDIKPANVLLTLHNGPQLLDFNLAYDPHSAEQAEAALRGGTLPYMAPEQLEAFLDPACWNAVGPRADLYSLGLVMYELLTGETPAVPDPPIPLPRAIRELLDRRLDRSFAPRCLNPDIPHALEAITLCCLEYDSARRYPSAAVLVEDLRCFLDDRPLKFAVNPSRAERLANWGRRNWHVLAAAALLGFAGSWALHQRITPVDQLASYRAAVAAVDRGDHQRAIALLGPLASLYPDSPLVQFYLSSEQAQQNNLHAAAIAYARAINAPHAQAVLQVRARETPHLVPLLEALGSQFEKGIDQGNIKPRLTYPALAHNAWAMAIALGSTSAKVHVHDAIHDQGKGEYQSALAKLTALIKRLERDPHGAMELNVNNCYRYRARLLLQLGDQERDRGSSASLAAARCFYDRAISDIERGTALAPRGDAARLNSLAAYRADAEIGLGNLAVRTHQRAEARLHSEQSRQILARLDPSIRREASFQKLEARLADLDKRIEAVPPQRLSAVLKP